MTKPATAPPTLSMSNNPLRTTQLHIQVTPNEHLWMKNAAQASGMSLSSWLRWLAFQAVPPHKRITKPPNAIDGLDFP